MDYLQSIFVLYLSVPY